MNKRAERMQESLDDLSSTMERIRAGQDGEPQENQETPEPRATETGSLFE
ncbi:hypothetical protein [Geobacter pickeringii]|nr:hypothetical protein [Geobacter pickeringii]